MQTSNPFVSTTLWPRGGKRVCDFTFAAVFLVLLSPLFLITAILVKLTSRGPVFFKQTRCGRDGVEFTVWKFRTMRGDRTPDPKELVPLDHPEITGLGRVLRRAKIDEIPQLVSVLTGQMAIIGPRPTLPDQIAAYNDFKRRRLLARPGTTGLAQVNGNTALEWDERIKYDVYYVKHCSFWLDLGIFLKTLAVLIRGEPRYARMFHDTPYAKSKKT